MKNTLFALLAAALLAGCAGNSDSADAKPAQTDASAKPAGAKPAGYLAITPVGSTTFMAGMPAMVTVAIRNVGQTTVDLPKWYAREADNLIFHYIKSGDGGVIPVDTKPTDWTTQKPMIDKPFYCPVTLMPENTMILRSELCFVDKMEPPANPEHYLVIVQLNQPEIHLASEPFTVTIVP